MASENKSDLINVLCFQGFGQNEQRIHKALASLRSLYKNKANFIILQAPNKLPIFQIDNIDTQTYCWYYYSEKEPLSVKWENVIDKIENTDELLGLNNSIELVKKHLSTNNYDYYLGFSQGSAFLSLLCQMNIIVNAKKLIFASGFYPLKYSLIKEKINIPSQHLIGLADTIIPSAKSIELANLLFVDPEITLHKGQHVIPKQKKLFEINKKIDIQI